jgi:hypothetical protein
VLKIIFNNILQYSLYSSRNDIDIIFYSTMFLFVKQQ